MSRPTWHRDTKLVRAGTKRSDHQETSEALFLNSGFVYHSAEEAAAAFAGEADRYVYSRYGNPTVEMFEERLAALEGAEACKATGTGMAAVFAALACQLEAGDRLVASRALFGACHAIVSKILPKWGIETELVDGTDMAAWQAALSRPCKLVFIESPSNPLLQLVDIAAVATLCKSAGAKLVVDNVFATPLYQSPLALGADIITYSTTKHIDGQGRLLGGAVLADKAFIDDIFMPFYRQTGASMSAFNAWVMLKSLETLPLRVEAQSKRADEIAGWLAQQDQISQLHYPGHPSHPQFELAQKQMTGGGNMLAFALTGGRSAAFSFLNALELVDISNNLGDSKSLACHPASTTHMNLSQAERDALGITDGHIRLSVGLEHASDIIADLTQALAKVS
ncbi:MAG: O-succinylhomoserine sulfhydrylase [Candidatus Puniceispirillaceae bacterium]